MTQYENINQIKTSKSVCLISHISPDADALSSMITLKAFLTNTFKINKIDLFVECDESIEFYDDIIGDEELNPEQIKYDAAIMLDCPNKERMGIYKNLFESAKLKIVIDHHATNDYSGDINIVEMCSSTCEIIYKISQSFMFELTKELKGKLYAGMITDTNNFTVGNFNGQTLRIASELIDHINHDAIYNQFLQNNTYQQMLLLSKSIQNLKRYKNGKILITHVTNEDLNEAKADVNDCSSIINKLATISGSRLVSFIYPKNDQFYVSMRAKAGYNVAQIAEENGGGGHIGAAAFLSDKTIENIQEYLIEVFEHQLKNRIKQYKIIF